MDGCAGGCDGRGSAPAPPRFIALGPSAWWGFRRCRCGLRNEKQSRRRPKTPPVQYGPADGATVPELPEDCPILRGGIPSLTRWQRCFATIRHPCWRPQCVKSRGYGGRAPCHHHRQRSCPCIVFGGPFCQPRVAAGRLGPVWRVATRRVARLGLAAGMRPGRIKAWNTMPFILVQMNRAGIYAFILLAILIGALLRFRSQLTNHPMRGRSVEPAPNSKVGDSDFDSENDGEFNAGCNCRSPSRGSGTIQLPWKRVAQLQIYRLYAETAQTTAEHFWVVNVYVDYRDGHDSIGKTYHYDILTGKLTSATTQPLP